MDSPSDRPLTEILSDFPDQSSLLPATLAHFTGPKGLNILVNGEIRVTPPGEFNDPLEFSPGIFEQPPTTQEWRAHFDNIRSFGYKAAEALFHNSHGAFPSLNAAKDAIINRPDIATECIRWYRQCLRQWFSDHFGVACFSAISPFRPRAVRHWAFYGDAHAGLAVVFNTRSEFFQEWAKIRLLFRVRYESKRPHCRLEHFEDRSTDHYLRLLRGWGAVKSKAWEPEREWRFIRPLTHAEPLLPIQRCVEGDKIVYLHKLWKSDAEAKEMIHQVVVGCRASTALENSARAACMHLGLSGDIVVRAKEHDSRFHLEPS